MLKKFRAISVFSAAVLVSAVLAGCTPQSPEQTSSQDWPETITFAGLALDGSTEILESYGLFVQVLQDELGIAVEFSQAATSPGVIEGMRSGKIQMASLTTFAYVLAKSKMNDSLELLGSTVRSSTASPGVKVYGAASSTNSEVNSLKDAAGKTVCFGNPSSTGTLFLAAGFSEFGIDGNPESSEDISPIYVGDAINSAYAVKNGDCAVGYLIDSTYNFSIPALDDLSQDDFKIVWESEIVPSAAFVISNDLPQSLVERVREIALTMLNKTYLVEAGYCATEEDCKFLSQVNWGWIATTDDFYDSVRETCRLVEAEICRL